jgi:hypothetical protein
MVACWIGAAYWFTASTSFANPAITIARSLTDPFSGIRPLDAPAVSILAWLVDNHRVSPLEFARLTADECWRWDDSPYVPRLPHAATEGRSFLTAKPWVLVMINDRRFRGPRVQNPFHCGRLFSAKALGPSCASSLR